MNDDLLQLYPFLSRLELLAGNKARCPAPDHDDQNASLSVTIGTDGKLLLRCHAECEFPDICKGLGIQPRDCFPAANKNGHGNGSHNGNGRRIVATYDYLDEDGTLLSQAVRFEPKGFSQRKLDGNGKWTYKLDGVKRVLFRLPELIGADPATTIYVVEGEKDANRLAKLGLVSTCNAMGAGKWRDTYSDHLAGRHVVILPDNDKPGRDHAEQVARSLRGKAATVKILAIPGLPDKGDVSDWLNAGGTVEELERLAANCPEWDGAKAPASPPATTSEDIEGDVEPAFRNHAIRFDEDKNGNPKPVIVPVPVRHVVEEMNRLTGEFPRSVCGSLFVDEAGQITWINKADALFAYLQRRCGVIDWRDGATLTTKAEFCQVLKQTQAKYDAIETLPHFPPMARHYYACTNPAPGSGDALRSLIDRFNPETDIDRDLLLAATVTPFAGIAGGSRPAIVITASGRGQGKSKAVAVLSHLAGGFIDLAANEDATTLKQRLLSPDGLTRRIALLDNVKSLKLSWAELEALITSPVISGKAMYVGEATRPNTFTWFITLNGVSLATDMAQRSVIIRLAKPVYCGTWFEDAIGFIDSNRAAILADIAAFFAQPPYELATFTRWGAWEQTVLSRLPEPSDAQRVIAERQAAADVEREEADLIEEHFAEQLARFGFDPECTVVHIANAVVVEWLNAATGGKDRTTAATKRMEQMIEEGAVKRITRNPCRTYGRGFIWTGASTKAGGTVDYDLDKRMRDHDSRADYARQTSRWH